MADRASSCGGAGRTSLWAANPGPPRSRAKAAWRLPSSVVCPATTWAFGVDEMAPTSGSVSAASPSSSRESSGGRSRGVEPSVVKLSVSDAVASAASFASGEGSGASPTPVTRRQGLPADPVGHAVSVPHPDVIAMAPRLPMRRWSIRRVRRTRGRNGNPRTSARDESLSSGTSTRTPRTIEGAPAKVNARVKCSVRLRARTRRPRRTHGRSFRRAREDGIARL